MPPKAAVRERAPDRGMQVLEEKLSILSQGPSRTRRNPALDVLTGRVPDERVQLLQANVLSVRAAAEAAGGSGAGAPSGPTAMVVPVAAVRMAAVARSKHQAPSPWLRAPADTRPRLRLVTPELPRWTRIPWLGRFLLRFAAPLYGGVSTV
ncbi:MAG: hypothetical protein E6I75_07765 [Chloroflexi bacterium]|nr:MAG: hypothetical protein E6I75_07765 [Chloroflexota bacterium]